MNKQRLLRPAGGLLAMALLLAVFLWSSFAGLQPMPAASAMPLAHLLNPDGTLKLDGGYKGAIDPAGWELTLDDNGRPVFTPAALTASGGWDHSYGSPGANMDFTGVGIYALAADSQGNVYVGGDFAIIGNQNADNLAMWDGANWHPVGLGTNTAVRVLAIDASDNLYVGGDFTQVINANAATLSANRLAMWDGSSWSLLGHNATTTGNGVNGSVRALALDGSGNLYAGGSFTTAYNASGSSVSANRVARWDGTGWAALGADAGSSGNGVNSSVNALAVDGGTVYVGGEFTAAYTSSASQVDANRIAAWDTGGGAWAALGADGGLTGNGLNSSVNALAVAPNSELYVGGSFTIAYDSANSSVATQRLARWDGATWGGSLITTGVNSTVNTLALNGDQLVFGGSFTRLLVDNSDANSVAIFDITTETWGILGAAGNGGTASSPVRGNGVSNLGVTALLADNGGIYLGGTEGPFRAYNSQTSAVGIDAIAHWDGAAWHALTNAQTRGANSRGVHSTIRGVHALALDSQGNLYVGGGFAAIGNISANSIARWDGAAWHRLGGDSGDKGNGVDGVVYALALDSNDHLYVGGDFTNAFSDSADGTGLSANRIAKWDGAAWSPLGMDTGTIGNGVNAPVWALAVDGSDTLAVGGQFATAYNAIGDNISANFVALWNGTGWAALGSDSGATGNGVNDWVRALAWQDSTLFVGGDFATAYNSSAGSVAASRVAQWSGGSWAALSGGVNGGVYALLVNGGDLYVGGKFRQADGATAGRVARWDGAVWHTLGAGSTFDGNGVNGDVYALGLSDDGLSLLVGGAFTTAYNDTGSSVAANRLAAWQIADGGWSVFGGGLDAAVNVLQATAGSAWVGGDFTLADRQPAAYIGRWLDDVQLADVAVAKTAVPSTLTVGETAVYTVTVANSGPVTSTNVILTDTLSLAAQMVILPTTSQGMCSASAAPLWTIECGLGNIAPDAIVTVSYGIAPEVAGSLVNTALAAGDTADLNPGNNVAQITITVADVPPTHTPTPTPSPEPSSLTLRRETLGSAGGTAVGGNLRLHGTLGQSSPISGQEGATRRLSSGYWHATLPILRMPGGGSIDWEQVDLTFPPLPPGHTVWLIPQVGAVDSLEAGSAAVGVSFHVAVYDEMGTAVTRFTEPYTVTIGYEDAQWQGAGVLDEGTLTLVYRDSDAAPWQDTRPCSGCVLDTTNNELVTLLDHATEFALVGRTESGVLVFLPMVVQP